MIVEEKVQEFDSYLPGMTSKRFEMKVTGRAFKLLSKDLYSDPILAVVRELVTNAFDSHAGAKKNKHPITIHLPWAFDPHFSVQDEGIGLDEEGLTIFTTYFASTKTETNEQAGALGLGSKSPFAYTSTFNVIAIKDGVRRSATCFLHEDSSPQMTIWETVETEEANGVTIRVPVTECSDFLKFKNALTFLYSFLEVKPKVVGGEFSPHDLTPSLKGKNWELYNAQAWNARFTKKAFVVQGGVPYDISADAGISGLVLYVPIGTLDFSMNRENLQYTDRTKEYLTQFLDDVRKEITLKRSKIFSKESLFGLTVTPEERELMRFTGISQGTTIDLSDGRKFKIMNGSIYLGEQSFMMYAWDPKTNTIHKASKHYNDSKDIELRLYRRKDILAIISDLETKPSGLRSQIKALLQKRLDTSPAKKKLIGDKEQLVLVCKETDIELVNILEIKKVFQEDLAEVGSRGRDAATQKRLIDPAVDQMDVIKTEDSESLIKFADLEGISFKKTATTLSQANTPYYLVIEGPDPKYRLGPNELTSFRVVDILLNTWAMAQDQIKSNGTVLTYVKIRKRLEGSKRFKKLGMIDLGPVLLANVKAWWATVEADYVSKLDQDQILRKNKEFVDKVSSYTRPLRDFQKRNPVETIPSVITRLLQAEDLAEAPMTSVAGVATLYARMTDLQISSPKPRADTRNPLFKEVEEWMSEEDPFLHQIRRPWSFDGNDRRRLLPVITRWFNLLNFEEAKALAQSNLNPEDYII